MATADFSPSDGVLVRETGAGRFQVEVQAGGQTFHADEPVDAGGDGSGPNPYELLAAGLGACTAMTLRLYAERKGWALKRAEVRVLHVRATLAARDRFAREIAIEGDLDDDQRHRLLEIANRCPVHLTLERGADVITTLVHHQEIEERDPLPDSHMRLMSEACAD
ncbi:MAG TPA: OsmC family protein [Phenylobacterium sp.]|jgi:putative redox protein